MTLLPDIFEMPDSTDELVRWLEERMCSHSFAETVAGLSVVQSAEDITDRSVVFSIANQQMESLLNKGLTCLRRQELLSLLGNPRELYRLQEEIFANGGKYWSSKFESAGQIDSTTWRRIQNSMVADQQRNEQQISMVSASPVEASIANSQRQSVRVWPVLGALAAAILIFLSGAWFGKGQVDSNSQVAKYSGGNGNRVDGQTRVAAWGWNRKNALEVQLDRVDKLNHIANLLSEWNSTKSQDAADLLIKAKQLRGSCDVLLAAELADLPADDIEWLKEKCKKWSAKIDLQIAKLSDPEQFDLVAGELNRLVHKSIFLIRSRAKRS